MYRLGDRKQRWHQSCNIKGAIMLFIGCLLIFTKSSFGIVFGLICLMCAFLDFRDAKKGWKMSDKRPPWADKHDTIEAKYHKRIKKLEDLNKRNILVKDLRAQLTAKDENIANLQEQLIKMCRVFHSIGCVCKWCNIAKERAVAGT